MPWQRLPPMWDRPCGWDGRGMASLAVWLPGGRRDVEAASRCVVRCIRFSYRADPPVLHRLCCTAVGHRLRLLSAGLRRVPHMENPAWASGVVR